MENKVAIIDLGTNTFHLLIAERDHGRYRIVRRERETAKIGMGGINSGMITDAGMTRALSALKKFKGVIDQSGVKKIFAFGTSALRSARNGKEFAAIVRRETGIDIKIISGDEEAEYIYSGIRSAMKMGRQISLIVDIGGGSTEFIIGDENEIHWKRSFEIGGQRLLEKYQEHDPILPREVENLNDHFRQVLAPLLEAMSKYKPEILIGSSGTFDTLSEIHCVRHGLTQPPDAPETPLSFESFKEIFGEFLTKDRAERLTIPGMIEMRVDMIVVACCLIQFLLDHHSFSAVRVSSYSLKEGVLASLDG